MSSTDHKDRVIQFFRLQLSQEGKPLILAEGIAGKSAAEQLREDLIEKLFAPN